MPVEAGQVRITRYGDRLEVVAESVAEPGRWHVLYPSGQAALFLTSTVESVWPDVLVEH